MNSKLFRSLLGVVALDQTYITITFPLVTLIFFDTQSRLFSHDTTYAARSFWYALCVAFPNFINLFFAPILSALSDQFGRKRILLIEIMNACFFTLSVGLGVYYGVLAFVFVGYLIRGALVKVNPIALAMIGDVTSKEDKVLYMGYLQFAISIGAALGPFIGGYLAARYYFAELNFALPFFIAACLAFMNVFAAAFLLPETYSTTARQAKSTTHNSTWKVLFRKKEIWMISILLLLIQFSWSMYYQFMPPILKTIYGFDSNQLGFFIGMIAFWLAMTTGVIIPLLNKWMSIRNMLFCSVMLVIVGEISSIISCTYGLGGNQIALWLAAMPVAAGDVLAYSCLSALYSNGVPIHHQGKTMGIIFIISGLTWSTTAILGGYLLSLSPILPLLIAPIGCVLALGLLQAKFCATFFQKGLESHALTP